MKIERYDLRPGCARLVIHKHVAYFTGHVAAGKQPTLKEQTAAVCARYDELFARFGLKKENILMANCFLKDIKQFQEYAEVFNAWTGVENPPAGCCVEAELEEPELLLELALIVAVDDDKSEGE